MVFAVEFTDSVVMDFMLTRVVHTQTSATA